MSEKRSRGRPKKDKVTVSVVYPRAGKTIREELTVPINHINDRSEFTIERVKDAFKINPVDFDAKEISKFVDEIKPYLNLDSEALNYIARVLLTIWNTEKSVVEDDWIQEIQPIAPLIVKGSGGFVPGVKAPESFTFGNLIRKAMR